MGQRPDQLGRREPVGASRHDDDEDLDSSTAAAREEIEQTRAEMTSTIDAIQDRLDPEVLSEQAKDTAHDVTDYAIREAKEAAREITDHALEQAREAVQDITGQARAALREATVGKVESMARTATDTAGGWRQSVLETIKANPMPAALVGLGVGWMLLNRPSGSSSQHSSPRYGQPGYPSAGYAPSRYGEPVYTPGSPARGGMSRAADDAQESLGHAAGRAQQTAGEMAEQVQGAAGQVLDQVQETGGQVVGQVHEQASRAQGFLQQQLEDNPLLVGAVAVAIGGALAATVPATRREDEMLGDTRDRLMGTAKDLTQDTMQKVGRVVEEAQSAAKQEAREQSLLPEDASRG
jgi:hypothetical protein